MRLAGAAPLSLGESRILGLMRHNFIFVNNLFHEMNTARSLNIGCPGLFEFRSMHFSNDLNCSVNFCIAVPSQNIWLQRCHTFHVDSKGV